MPILTKAKENYKLFLENKGKNIPKVSKTVKNPNSDDIESVTVRHPKTTSNL